MTHILAAQALLASGWHSNVLVSVNNAGRIERVQPDAEKGPDSFSGLQVDCLLPAPCNLHSHSFQRAMAGLAERRGPGSSHNFWSWREVMYRFLEVLNPEQVEVIAALAQMEMLEAGFAAVAEFHYLHHGPGGNPYGAPHELSLSTLAAAARTGIGYVHLPVLYQRGGLAGQALEPDQLRFGCTIDQFVEIYQRVGDQLSGLPPDFSLGVAPHSLRAVDREGLAACVQLAPSRPVHIHVAEQLAEVSAVTAAMGAPPVRWLLDHTPVDGRWCMVHATHMTDDEVRDLAHSGAVAGLCPLTEANLGDGIFAAEAFLSHGGLFGIGSDSNIRIALNEELRTLESSQRLGHQTRLVITSSQQPSNGRLLFDHAAAGGAAALGRNSGCIKTGALADLLALDMNHPTLWGLRGDDILDAWVFAGGNELVREVWAAGRHQVTGGRHRDRERIVDQYRQIIGQLRQAL